MSWCGRRSVLRRSRRRPDSVVCFYRRCEPRPAEIRFPAAFAPATRPIVFAVGPLAAALRALDSMPSTRPERQGLYRTGRRHSQSVGGFVTVWPAPSAPSFSGSGVSIAIWTSAARGNVYAPRSTPSHCRHSRGSATLVAGRDGWFPAFRSTAVSLSRFASAVVAPRAEPDPKRRRMAARRPDRAARNLPAACGRAALSQSR